MTKKKHRTLDGFARVRNALSNHCRAEHEGGLIRS